MLKYLITTLFPTQKMIEMFTYKITSNQSIDIIADKVLAF